MKKIIQHPRTQLGIKVSVGVGIAMVILWLFAFFPFVSTDDARVAATLIRVAPEAVGGRIIKVSVTEGDRVKKGDLLVELNHAIPEAQLQRAKAKALLTERELHRINELVDGIVVQKIAEEGNILEPGQVAVTISDVDHAWISANIEETSVHSVKAGQPVSVVVDEGGTLKGKVSEVRAAVASQFALIPSDSGSGNFTKVVQRVPIKIELEPHPNQVLRSGQSVEIKIRVH